MKKTNKDFSLPHQTVVTIANNTTRCKTIYSLTKYRLFPVKKTQISTHPQQQ